MLIVPQNTILKIMQEVVDKFLIPKFDSYGMEATGEWRKNLEVKSGQNVGYINGRQYSEQLALGRKPGKRPPIAPIEKWVNAKLGIHGKQATGVAFAIATKIAKEGTTWYQRGGTDLIKVLESDEVVNYINSQIGNYLTVQVESEINKMANQILSQ